MGKYTVLNAPTFTVENTEPYMGDLKLKTNLEYTGFNSNNLIVDFGKLKREGEAKVSLLFKNTVKFKDINIIAVSGNCGCTIPTFRKETNGDYLVTIGINLTRMGFEDNTKFVKITMNDKRVMIIEVKVYGL